MHFSMFHFTSSYGLAFYQTVRLFAEIEWTRSKRSI